MKNVLTIIIVALSFSLNAQSKSTDDYLKKEFDKSIVKTYLFIDKVTQPKIDNVKFIQSAINYCAETKKCNGVVSEYPRQISPMDLTSISYKNVTLMANLMIVSK